MAPVRTSFTLDESGPLPDCGGVIQGVFTSNQGAWMRNGLSMTAAVVGLILSAGVAQAQGVRVELTGAYQSLSGDDFEGTNSGIGGEAQVRFGMGRMTLGVGALLSSHGIDGIDDKLKILGLLAEPRFVFALTGSPLSPFIAARFAYLRETLTTGGQDFKATGFAFGGGAGVNYRISPLIQILVAAYFQSARFGDVDVDGTTSPGTDASGTAMTLRAGLSIGR